MFPVAPAIQKRLEVRIELAADRAALGVAARGALAGALLAGLGSTEASYIGAAGLSATEARIAHLAGNPNAPGLPVKATAVSVGLLVVISAATADLSTSAHLVRMTCRFCAEVLS